MNITAYYKRTTSIDSFFLFVQKNLAQAQKTPIIPPQKDIDIQYVHKKDSSFPVRQGFAIVVAPVHLYEYVHSVAIDGIIRSTILQHPIAIEDWLDRKVDEQIIDQHKTEFEQKLRSYFQERGFAVQIQPAP